MVEVKDSGIKEGGMGLFACCDFSSDNIITIYMGTVIEENIDGV